MIQAKIYYAHSKKIYGTPEEKAELEFLKYNFTSIVDPNRGLGELGNLSEYLKIISICKMVVCSEYQGYIGRGVYFEINKALENNKPVFCIKKTKGKYYLERVQNIEIYDKFDWAIRYGKVLSSSNGGSKNEIMARSNKSTDSNIH